MRGKQRRADLSHVAYARATWEWWCGKNGIEFTIVDRTPGDDLLPTAPATILRWFALAEIIRTRPVGTRVALVDADTMIRWDTPDFFDIYDNAWLCAAPGVNKAWIKDTIAAFQPLFPGVVMKPERYFNAGLVLAGKPQLELFSKFGSFCVERFAEIDKICRASNVGTDQTPLNFMVRREKQKVLFMSFAFNLMYCFGWRDLATRMEFEDNLKPDWRSFRSKALALPNAFDFLNQGYIWHFTNTVAARRRVMAETWKIVRHFYR